MKTIDHPHRDSSTIRSRCAFVVKTLVKTTGLLVVSARMIPGVVIGSVNIVALMLSGWTLLMVFVGLLPYWSLLGLRLSPDASDPERDRLAQHPPRASDTRVSADRTGVRDDDHGPLSVKETPVIRTRRGLAA